MGGSTNLTEVFVVFLMHSGQILG